MAHKVVKRKKAVFITVEGFEGSGKSSVINFLKKWLRRRGWAVKIFRDPGSTEIGEKIRRILLDKNNKKLSLYTEFLLYLAARTQLIEEKIKKSLFRYDFVICDRFLDSTFVYQIYAGRMNKFSQKAVKAFSLGIRPDITLLLDTVVEEGLGRIKHKDRIEARPLNFHRKLRKGYLRLAKKYPRRIKVINAQGKLENIFKRAEQALKRKLNAKRYRIKI